MALHRIRKGLDLPLAGAPTQAVDVAPRPARVALVGADYIGLKPTLLVQPGDRVLRGTPLFDDKKRPGVRFVAPAAGTVAAIHRGEMRAFQSLVIDVDPDDGPEAQVAFASFPGSPPEPGDADAVRALLVESGHVDRVPRPALLARAGARLRSALDLRHRDRHASACAGGRRGAGRAQRRLSRRAQRHRRAVQRQDLRLHGGRLGSHGARGRAHRRRGIRGPASGRHPRPAHPPAGPRRPGQDRLAHRLPGRRRDRAARHHREARRRARDLARRAGRGAPAPAAHAPGRIDSTRSPAASSCPARSG